jgi:thiamine kinase-like enzyme
MAQRYVGAAAELERILARLEPALGVLKGAPVALEGGITNRNFRVCMGGAEYVVRLPGRDTGLLGIDRRAERLAGETAARLGIAPDVAAADADYLVTRFVASGPADSTQIGERVEEVARSMRSFHDSGVDLPAVFWVPNLLNDYAAVVRRRGGALPGDYSTAVDVAARIAAVLPLTRARPCHNDLLAGNLISPDDGAAMLIVDWEYAGMGHPCFDLGNLSINNDFDEDTDERLLSAYDGRAPARERSAALKLMRVLSDAREAAWGVVQGVVSEIDFDFDAYAREHFERLHTAVARPSFTRWLGEATWCGSQDGHGQTA